MEYQYEDFEVLLCDCQPKAKQAVNAAIKFTQCHNITLRRSKYPAAPGVGNYEIVALKNSFTAHKRKRVVAWLQGYLTAMEDYKIPTM